VEFTAIGDSGYSGAQLTVALGSHTFSSQIPFGVTVYGFDNADSYGYPGGGSLAPVNSVTSVALAPATGFQQTGTPYELTATVLNNLQNAVPGVRVDFTVTGANTASGSATTNELGMAVFSYTGTNTGDDTVTASAAGLGDSSTVAWSSTPLLPPDAPRAEEASGVTATEFVANWTASHGATGYLIDVRVADAYVSGYENLDVGDATSVTVSGLVAGTEYTYEVRAYNDYGTSHGSNVITVTTASGPEIQIVIEEEEQSPGSTPHVGDDLAFLVTVQNVGTAGAEGVLITIPLPPGTELISAEVLSGPAAASLPENMMVVDGTLIIDCGDLQPGSDVQVRLVLQATAGGTVNLVANAQYGDGDEQIEAAHPTEVAVEDTYIQIVTTTGPLCGAAGLLPLVLTGILMMLPAAARRCRQH
jgi:uncharacterized repeat protein (TIGR01451 family)